MKTKLSYTVRNTRAPGELRDSIVPVIVERLSPVELETVVENCIDRGLIAGLKPTAAHGIAEGVAAQLAREFSLGRGVQFGNYFYGRPYLSGQVGSNGQLTGDNKINVRLYKGAAFKLALADFSLSFDGAGDAVKVDSIFGDTNDAGGNTYGQIVPNAPVVINGRNLYAAGDTDKVVFDEVDGTGHIEVTEFRASGDGILSFNLPNTGTQVVPGKSYEVKVERTDANGVTRTSVAKKVSVYGEPVAAPTITAAYSTGKEGDTILCGGGDLVVEGDNLETVTQVELCNDEGEAFDTIDVTYAEGKLTAPAGTIIDPSNPGTGLVKVTTDGGTATRAVTYVME